MANFGKEGKPEPVIAKISQETLAEMVGTTRSGVQSRPQESGQDVKWSFCLTGGTRCPANQERQ